MQFVLFEDDKWQEFLPLVFTRPVSGLRTGILTTIEKWSAVSGKSFLHMTRDYLHPIFPSFTEGTGLFINGRLLPDPSISGKILSLKKDQVLLYRGKILAICFDKNGKIPTPGDLPAHIEKEEYAGVPFLLNTITDLFEKNGAAIRLDYDLLTKGARSDAAGMGNIIIGPTDHLFIGEGAVVRGAIINTTGGPVYIGKNAEVMEGALIRGPFAMGEGAVLKMGAKIYGPVTLGPYCKAGGEISSSILAGYSNKAHDGFLGHSVIGEWCNLGADTNNSNLKNNYSPVRIWNYARQAMTDTGLVFCGLIMGDHSRCGINTMFNTGTVVGVNSNIYGSDFVPKYFPSFAWGGSNGMTVYDFDKALETAARVMERRKISLDAPMAAMLRHIFTITADERMSL